MIKEFYVFYSKIDNVFFGYNYIEKEYFLTENILDAYWFETELDVKYTQYLTDDDLDFEIIEITKFNVNNKIKKIMSIKEHLYHLDGIVDISYSDLFYVHHNLDKNMYRYLVFTLDRIDYDFLKPYYLRMRTNDIDNFAIFINDLKTIVNLKLTTNFKLDHIYDRVTDCWVCNCQ